MTTEEFQGHFLAMLHGPNGNALAGQVLMLALEDPRAGDAIGELLAESTSDLMAEVMNLQVHAHLTDAIKHPPEGESAVRWAVDLAGIRSTIIGKLREQLRARLSGHEVGRMLADRIRLPLGGSEG